MKLAATLLAVSVIGLSSVCNAKVSRIKGYITNIDQEGKTVSIVDYKGNEKQFRYIDSENSVMGFSPAKKLPALQKGDKVELRLQTAAN